VEIGPARAFDRPRTPEEIMDRLEERVGPKGRKLFEQFLRKVNRLEEQLLQERQQQEQPQQAAHGIAVGRLRRRPNRKGVGHGCKVSQHNRRALIRVPVDR
jgi:hypothetical protein